MQGGDPHFWTCDKRYYDFYGNGEYQACMSKASDFGMQYRLFSAGPCVRVLMSKA